MYLDILDGLICIFRKTLDSNSLDNQDVESVFQFDRKIYNLLIDCAYLLEDTQLAKKDYTEFKLEGPTKKPSQGERYLRLYGILNACFLQKEAIIACNKALSIDESKDKL